MIDERKGRRTARHLGVRVTGALGIIAAARRAGAIPSAMELIEALKNEAGFFVSKEAETDALRLAGEAL